MRDRQAITLRSEAADRIDPKLANDPIENADRHDPIDPIDRIEPTDPIDRIDPFDPIDNTESSDLIDNTDPRLFRTPHIMPAPAFTAPTTHPCPH